MNEFRRKEDNRLVRGLGSFVDDAGGVHVLHMKLARSPYAHARILSVDVLQAEKLDGVLCTLTGAEVAAQTKKFIQMAPPPASEIVDYCMATDKVRYQGEPVAAVVAISPAIAADAVELIRVEYEPLPPVMDAVASLGDKVVLHETAGTNKTWGSLFEWGEVDQAFTQADVIVEVDRLKFHRFSSTPLETFAACATWGASNSLDILCNIIQPGVAIKFMAPALGLSTEQIRIKTQDIGGGFGIKQNIYPYLMIAALCSKKVGHRQVKWVEERREHLQASAHGNERTFLDIKVALKSDGEITAVSARHVDDCGAYPRYEPLGCVIWSQVAPASYRLKNISILFEQAVTNKCPVGPNRGYSRMQHVWFFERVIDICGRELGIAPDVMRKRNYIPEMPWTTPNGCVYDSGDYARMLDTAKETIGWNEWLKKRDAMRVEGRLVGVGIGTALDSGTNNFGQSRIMNPNSPFSGNSEAANVRLGIDGTVTVIVGSVPQGQSHETVAAQVVASELGISEELVFVARGFDSERATFTSHSGTYASQFAVTGLGAIHGAVQKLKGELVKVAAVMLGVPADRLKIGTFGGIPGVASDDGAQVSFLDISSRINTGTADLPKELADITLNCRYVYRPPFSLPDPKRKYGNLTLTYAAQVHIAVVEIDRDTHNVNILDYAVVDDCGRVVNHTIVKGQVIGSTAHGIGAALMEHLRYDEYGNLLTSTFSDYCPITILNMPDVKYVNVESPSPFTFNGAKGMGEGGGGALHCLSSAIQDAVSGTGIVVDRSHYTPSDLYNVITQRQGAKISTRRRAS